MTSSIDLVISPRAQRDRRGILLYTLKTWGIQQRDRYDQVLEDGFDLIRTHPDIGVAAPGRPSTIRELILEHHIIQYRREADRVVILRLVGHRQRRR